MKEKDKSANATKRPAKCPSALAPITPGKATALPAEKLPKEKTGGDDAQPDRSPKATWRVTPSYGAEVLLVSQTLAAGGNDPWRLALETRDMLLWRRQALPNGDAGIGPEAKLSKRPVTWHVKG